MNNTPLAIINSRWSAARNFVFHAAAKQHIHQPGSVMTLDSVAAGLRPLWTTWDMAGTAAAGDGSHDVMLLTFQQFVCHSYL